MFCRTSHHCQMLQELQLWKITLSLLLLTRALYPFLFSWLGYDFMEFNSNSCSPSNSRSPRVFHAANVLSACLVVAWRVEGKAQGLSLESYPENGPEHLNLCLASCVFPAHSTVVWNDGVVGVKNGTVEHKWWSNCGCTVLVEDTSRADESTADLPLVRGDREWCWWHSQVATEQ